MDVWSAEQLAWVYFLSTCAGLGMFAVLMYAYFELYDCGPRLPLMASFVLWCAGIVPLFTLSETYNYPDIWEKVYFLLMIPISVYFAGIFLRLKGYLSRGVVLSWIITYLYMLVFGIFGNVYMRLFHLVVLHLCAIITTAFILLAYTESTVRNPS